MLFEAKYFIVSVGGAPGLVVQSLVNTTNYFCPTQVVIFQSKKSIISGQEKLRVCHM